MRTAVLAAILGAALAAAAPAQNPMPSASPGPAAGPEATRGLEIKWMRDSEEYASLTREVYRLAERAVSEAARRQARGRAWAVVLDIDETTLDNSVYQLERLAYRVPFDSASWNAFVRRVESGVVPGVRAFVATVRRLGGHVAWISGRVEYLREPTRANLARHGLWQDDDRLCLFTGEPQYNKAARRAEVAGGSGRCAWEGTPLTILAFVGDQMGDFPQAGESDPDAGNDDAFGVRCFLLPQPMYGTWTTRVTRRDR